MSAVIITESTKRLSVSPGEIHIALAPRLADMDRDGTLAQNTALIAEAVAGHEGVLTEKFWLHYNLTSGLKEKLTGAKITPVQS